MKKAILLYILIAIVGVAGVFLPVLFLHLQEKNMVGYEKEYSLASVKTPSLTETTTPTLDSVTGEEPTVYIKKQPTYSEKMYYHDVLCLSNLSVRHWIGQLGATETSTAKELLKDVLDGFDSVMPLSEKLEYAVITDYRLNGSDNVELAYVEMHFPNSGRLNLYFNYETNIIYCVYGVISNVELYAGDVIRNYQEYLGIDGRKYSNFEYSEGRLSASQTMGAFKIAFNVNSTQSYVFLQLTCIN